MKPTSSAAEEWFLDGSELYMLRSGASGTSLVRCRHVLFQVLFEEAPETRKHSTACRVSLFVSLLAVGIYLCPLEELPIDD